MVNYGCPKLANQDSSAARHGFCEVDTSCLQERGRGYLIMDMRSSSWRAARNRCCSAGLTGCCSLRAISWWAAASLWAACAAEVLAAPSSGLPFASLSQRSLLRLVHVASQSWSSLPSRSTAQLLRQGMYCTHCCNST